MTISFDLDDTLIPGVKRFDTEPRGFLQRIFNLELIRVGTIELMKALKRDGHRIFIYTTSLRSTGSIWRLFFLNGIRIDKIINQNIHNTALKGMANIYSKYPPAFGIDVHIDDSKGVAMAGDRHGFNTIIVSETDVAWTDTLKRIIARY